MKRNAQGMPLNLVILSVILLIVLVVLLFIFTQRTGQFTQGLESCESKGGICIYEGHADYPCKGPTLGNTDCIERYETEDKVTCCLALS